MCCCPTCNGCKDTVPDSLTIVLAGATDPNCQGWHINGTYILPYVDCVTYIPFGDLLDDARYIGSFAVGTAGCAPYPLTIGVEVVFEASSGTRVILIEANGVGADPIACPPYSLKFDLTTTGQTEAYDCTGFSSLNIPLVSDTCSDPVTCHLSS